MRWLVVNADDAGFAEPTDAAILRCARAGIVRSATVAANGPTADAFVRQALDAGLDLGLHVNLTGGRPLAGPHGTLTDRAGRFLRKAELWRRVVRGEIDADEIRREVAAQWERLRDLGVRATHVDGHNHVHLIPAACDVLRDVAVGLWMRAPVGSLPAALPIECHRWARRLRGPWKRADSFVGYDFSADPTADVFLGSLDESARVSEFMVHPGARPGTRFTSSALRDRETETLCGRSLDRELDRLGYRLASFSEVPCGS